MMLTDFFPTRSSTVGRGEGSRRLLHHSLRRHVREDRHEGSELRRAPSGGE